VSTSRNSCRLVGGRRLDAERVRKAYEKAEQSRHIRRLGDLLVGPTHVAQALDLLVGDAVGRARDRAGEFQQETLARRQSGGVEVTVAERLRHRLELFALQLQEPRVGAESIPAAVDRGDVGGDHLVLRAGQRTVREMYTRGGVDGGQEIWPQAHGLEDGRHDAERALRPGRRVLLGQMALCVRLGNHLDACHERSNEQAPERCQKLSCSRDLAEGTSAAH
jgi:hypothetical protein